MQEMKRRSAELEMSLQLKKPPTNALVFKRASLDGMVVIKALR